MDICPCSRHIDGVGRGKAGISEWRPAPAWGDKQMLTRIRIRRQRTFNLRNLCGSLPFIAGLLITARNAAPE